MEKIRANVIFEMMGRPKNHLEIVMNDFLKRFETERGIKLISKTVNDARKVEEKDKDGKKIKFVKGKELFTTFADVELEFDEFLGLLRILFVYMPSHVEITSPDNFEVAHIDMTMMVNEITGKLHQYDAIAKNAMMHNQILANRVQMLERAIQNGAGMGFVPVNQIENKKPIKTKREIKKKTKKD